MQVPSAELALTPRLPCGPGSCDLEFHRFPVLFTPGSWPRFDRDVALFNFWANETLPKTKNRPNIGSGVAFFNRTKPARDLLTAWSEAMANPHNERAPDDQVLSPLRPGPRVSCPPSERPGAPHCPCSPATNSFVNLLSLAREARRRPEREAYGRPNHWRVRANLERRAVRGQQPCRGTTVKRTLGT